MSNLFSNNQTLCKRDNETSIEKLLAKYSNVYQKNYDFIEKQGKDIPKINKNDLPRNKDLEILLTKILTYSYFLGFSRSKRKKSLKLSINHYTDFSFDLPYHDAAEYFEKIYSIKADLFYEELSKHAGKAFTISYINSIETLEDIKFEFSKQLKHKFDPIKLKEIIQETAEKRGDSPLNPFHLDTVVRTNILSAYSKGRIRAQIEAGNPYWQYIATLDGRETELCYTLDGKIFRSDDPFWKTYYPPNHFNCRSHVVSLDEDSINTQDIETDGEEFLKKSGLNDINPGKGFEYSAQDALDKYLENKTKELKIDNVKEAVPVELK